MQTGHRVKWLFQRHQLAGVRNLGVRCDPPSGVENAVCPGAVSVGLKREYGVPVLRQKKERKEGERKERKKESGEVMKGKERGGEGEQMRKPQKGVEEGV